MTRADEPGSGQSQWYGDQAQWYPETTTQRPSDQESDAESGKPRKAAAHPTRKDLPVMSPATAQEQLPTAAAEQTDKAEQQVADEEASQEQSAEPEPEQSEEPEETAEKDEASDEHDEAEHAEEDEDEGAAPVVHGQDGPPPPFEDKGQAQDGPPPPFEDKPLAQDGPPPPFEDKPLAQDGPPPPYEGEADAQESKAAATERDEDEDMVLRKPLKLPPSAYELPRNVPAPMPTYEPDPQQLTTPHAPPPQPAAVPLQAYAGPPPSVHKPGLWHRLHFPVGVFLVAFGVTNALNAALRWNDHRTEIAEALGKAESLADSAGTILVAAHLVEALLIIAALVGLTRRRSVWFLPAIFGWMTGFGLFVGLDLWAGHVTKLLEHIVFLGGFTLLLFISYALGIKARVNSTRTADAAMPSPERPLTRTQEVALAALSSWQRRQNSS